MANLVDYVDAFVESRFLDNNVLLVDTPGTNTTIDNHIRITNDQIARSDAAIFLLDVDTQLTRSDSQVLEEVEGAVARLFFVVNKIDKRKGKEVDRALQEVERKIREAVEDPSKLRERLVFGVSGAKALLGRTGYADTPILEEDEWSKQDSPEFRKTLVEESGIVAFEEDLERYLFGSDKARDLLHSPLSFIQSETNKIASKLNRQIEVLDGTSDLSDLELQIKEMERIVEKRKHELEGMTDELSEELSSALSNVEKSFDEKCKLEVESLKDEIRAYDSFEVLKTNWSDGANLATLPGRKLANLDRQARKLINDSVERVLRKQTRTIRRQIEGELKEISLELPELLDMTLQLPELEIDTVRVENIKKLQIQIEDCNQKLKELDASYDGQNESDYNALQDEQQRLIDEFYQERQLLGCRPSVEVRPVIKEEYEDREGLGGFLKYLWGTKTRREYPEEVKDDQERRDYDKRLETIEDRYRNKLAETERVVEKAKKEYRKEAVEKRRAEKLEELNRSHQQALEKAKLDHDENIENARQRAAESTRNRLVSSFQVAEETLKYVVEQSVAQTRDIATGFIDNVMEELDTTLTTNKEELAKLKSLMEEKESEQEASKGRIRKALEELQALGAEASGLEDEHEAFIEGSSEVAVTATNNGE